MLSRVGRSLPRVLESVKGVAAVNTTQNAHYHEKVSSNKLKQFLKLFPPKKETSIQIWNSLMFIKLMTL